MFKVYKIWTGFKPRVGRRVPRSRIDLLTKSQKQVRREGGGVLLTLALSRTNKHKPRNALHYGVHGRFTIRINFVKLDRRCKSICWKPELLTGIFSVVSFISLCT